VFIDAGANRGDYSTMVVEMADSAKRDVEVHAFEPSSTCVQMLKAAFSDRPTVHIIQAALSDKSGEGLLHGEDGSTQASLIARTDIVQSHESVTVQLVALADYISASRLKRIDLLKLDVEGSELMALVGLREYLSPDIVDIIQFEYGGTSLDARTSLRELYTLLASRGYVLAKLLPSAVEVRDYSGWMENYAYANYLALSPRWIAPQSRGV
jgi:FkbM family methyltransferase